MQSPAAAPFGLEYSLCPSSRYTVAVDDAVTHEVTVGPEDIVSLEGVVSRSCTCARARAPFSLALTDTSGHESSSLLSVDTKLEPPVVALEPKHKR